MKNLYLTLTILIFACQAFGQVNKKNGVEAISYDGSPASKFDVFPPAKASVANETVIWGDNPGEGDFDGGLSGWTVENVSDSTQQLQLWYWDEDATVVGGFFVETTLASETVANGVMAFNADYLTTEGDSDPDNLPPFPYPIHVGDLISPTIDMTDAIDPQILFTQAFRGLVGEGSDRGALYAYSIDDGMSWSAFEPVNDDLEIREYSENPDYKRLDIPDAAGEAAVKIKFRFSGNFYFWMIDDVKIVERPAHNLVISEFGVAVGEYYMAPASQVYPVYFGGYISNPGGTTQSNVALNAKIDVYDTDGNLLTDDVFSGSTSIESLEAGAMDSLLLFDSADNFTPPIGENERRYEIEYKITQDSTDLVPDDNIHLSSFYMNNGYYSKGSLDDDFEPILTSAYRPQNNTSYEYGIHMYVPNGSLLDVSHVRFAYSAGDNPLEGNSITILLRKWEDANENTLMDEGELDIVGYGIHTYTTEENRDVVTASLFDESTNEEGLRLEDDTHYVLTCQYGGSEDMFMLVDESIEYDPVVIASLERAEETGDARLVRYADVLYTDQWYEFGFDIVGVPAISMITTDVDVAIEDAQGIPVQVALHPNPASDILNVALTTDISNDNWKVSISDMSGRSVLWNRTATRADFPLQININDLAKGTYMLTLENNGQIHTERFVKN